MKDSKLKYNSLTNFRSGRYLRFFVRDLKKNVDLDLKTFKEFIFKDQQIFKDYISRSTRLLNVDF